MSSEGAKVYEGRIADRKRELFQALDTSCSSVLELGIGSGPNLGYYGSGVKQLTGLDPNPFMLEKTAALKTTAGGVLPALVRGVGEEMPFDDNSFDAVVSTLVLCSVQDPERVMEEIARVLKPGGRWLFMEHVRESAGTAPFLKAAQDAFDPLQVHMAAGCHLNRQTDRSILTSAAFDRVSPMVRFSAMGDKGEQFLISPTVMGVAWKAPKALSAASQV